MFLGARSGASRAASTRRRRSRAQRRPTDASAASRCPRPRRGGGALRASAAARDLFGPAFVEHYAALCAPGRGRRLPSLRLRPRSGSATWLRSERTRRRSGPPDGEPRVRAERRAGRRVRPDGFVVVEQIIDPALARRALDALRGPLRRPLRDRPLSRRMELAAGASTARPHPPDLQRLEVRPRHRPGRAAARHRTRLRTARGLAGRPAQPGQRAVEAARAARRSGSTRIRATSSGPSPSEWVSCWIALGGHHGRPGHGRVRAWLAPLGAAGE